MERILELNGTIAEDSWFDDDVTPKMFRDELMAGEGDITVWINSPGGDCVAAAQIYNMLASYKGNVTVKIDGIAASAASVIAMAGDTVLMSPVSMLMIHNPATIAIGDHTDMQKAMDMLDEVKESIINAYAIKTGMSRSKLGHLMDAETWMNARKSVELGFADDIMVRGIPEAEKRDPDEEEETEKKNPDENGEEEEEKDSDKEKEKTLPFKQKALLYSQRTMSNVLMNKLEKHYAVPDGISASDTGIEETTVTGRSADEIRERLNFIKKFI